MKRRFTEDSYRKEPWMASLVSALKSCKSEEEILNFLRDIGTLSELQSWSERLEVARLLSQGLSYRQVSKVTGASTTTVTRVAHFLENGEGGYRSVLKTHRHHRQKVGPRALTDTGISTASEESPIHPSPEVSQKKESSLQKYLNRTK